MQICVDIPCGNVVGRGLMVGVMMMIIGSSHWENKWDNEFSWVFNWYAMFSLTDQEPCQSGTHKSTVGHGLMRRILAKSARAQGILK